MPAPLREIWSPTGRSMRDTWATGATPWTAGITSGRWSFGLGAEASRGFFAKALPTAGAPGRLLRQAVGVLAAGCSTHRFQKYASTPEQVSGRGSCDLRFASCETGRAVGGRAAATDRIGALKASSSPADARSSTVVVTLQILPFRASACCGDTAARQRGQQRAIRRQRVRAGAPDLLCSRRDTPHRGARGVWAWPRPLPAGTRPLSASGSAPSASLVSCGRRPELPAKERGCETSAVSRIQGRLPRAVDRRTGGTGWPPLPRLALISAQVRTSPWTDALGRGAPAPTSREVPTWRSLRLRRRRSAQPRSQRPDHEAIGRARPMGWSSWR